MAIVFETARLVARQANMETLDFVLEQERHPDNSPYLWQNSRQLHEKFLTEPGYLTLIYYDKESGEPMGYTLMYENTMANSMELRQLSVVKKGIGLGREVLQACIDYSFDRGIERFWLDVYPFHHVGIKLYESVGMHLDGTLRHSFRDERGYLDQRIYSLLRSEVRK